MDSEFDGLWAVVTSAGGRYIGRIASQSRDSAVQETENGEMMTLNPVYELAIIQIPVQSPRGIVMQRDIRALPLGANLENHTVHTKPTDIWFLQDMQERDQLEYKNIVNDAIRTAQNARATRAGLHTAVQLPGGNA